jgi:hypothetical protein
MKVPGLSCFRGKRALHPRFRQRATERRVLRRHCRNVHVRCPYQYGRRLRFWTGARFFVAFAGAAAGRFATGVRCGTGAFFRGVGGTGRLTALPTLLGGFFFIAVPFMLRA